LPGVEWLWLVTQDVQTTREIAACGPLPFSLSRQAVKLSGFGNFDLRDKNRRPGRNPKTGEEIPISARRVVTFRPGQKLKDVLTILLRVAGTSLIVLAGLHFPIARHLKWREDAARLSPVNASIFRVHSFFICFILLMMGLPCVLEPAIFLETSPAGAWLAWSFSAFWFARLFVQWFVFPRALWRGKPKETIVHAWMTVAWFLLAALFTVCALWQRAWRP
jgi:hypothetical protein